MADRNALLEDALDAFVGYLRASTPRQSAAVASAALTVHQFRALLVIGMMGEPTTTEVAEHVGVQASVGTGIVHRLVDSGLVARREDPADRRIRRLVLTSKGKALSEEAVGAARAQRRAQLQCLSEAQLVQLADISRTLHEYLPQTR